jgi:LysM repeat protein
VLPVTPEAYRWEQGINLETVNISETGDVYLPGGESRYSGKIECLFPANDYPWLTPGAGTDPYSYVNQFAAWAKGKKPVRYVVSGTEINAQVYVESIQYEEKDGSGDVYATICLREYVDLEAKTVSNLDTSGGGTSGNSGQSTATASASAASQQYTVVSGDTLSALCRKFYGNGSSAYYKALAAYNGITNPNVLRVGQVLTIPAEDALLVTDTSKVSSSGSTALTSSKTVTSTSAVIKERATGYREEI